MLKKILSLFVFGLIIISCSPDDPCNSDCWLDCISDKQNGKISPDVNCDEVCPTPEDFTKCEKTWETPEETDE